MATTFSATIGLLWTPPSAAANSGNSALQIQGAINAQNVGSLDVPAATAPSTVLPVPFGAVNSAKLFVVKNNMSSDIGIRLNGHVTDDFQVAPGSTILVASPTGPQASPLASASVVTTSTPTVTETISFWVMGD